LFLSFLVNCVGEFGVFPAWDADEVFYGEKTASACAMKEVLLSSVILLSVDDKNLTQKRRYFHFHLPGSFGLLFHPSEARGQI
jgi:hypothetical protein